MVEDLADVLLHLLRNCVDHGIESAEARTAAGKSADGRVGVRALRERDSLLLEVSDDGRGFNPDKLRRAAVAAGRLSVAAAAALSDEAAIQLACLPGISTATTVTDISGRGIGLDAAKATIEAFGGSFEIDSRAGIGTCFRIGLPLSVSLIPVLLAEIAGEVIALPIAKVQAAIDLPPPNTPLRFGGRDLSVQPLAELLGFVRQRPAAAPIALVVGTGDDVVAVSIDRLVGQQDAVVKPLSRPLDRIAGLAGVTLLGSGQPVFILEVGRLLSRT
jgi:two-component system chemotaxis sensor kinase CheA